MDMTTFNVNDFYSNEKKSTPTDIECSHSEIIEENEINICFNCGEIIEKINTPNKTVNPNHDYSLKKNYNSKLKKEELTCYNISEKIANETIELFEKIVKEKTFRGKIRKSIITCCLCHVFQKTNKNINIESVNIYGLPQKSLLKGTKIVNISFSQSEQSKLIFNEESILPPRIKITFENLIEIEMNKFLATPQQIKEVIEMYNVIKNDKLLFNGTKPHSIICGLIYIWLFKNEKLKNISNEQFLETVKISFCTITKVRSKIEHYFLD